MYKAKYLERTIEPVKKIPKGITTHTQKNNKKGRENTKKDKFRNEGRGDRREERRTQWHRGENTVKGTKGKRFSKMVTNSDKGKWRERRRRRITSEKNKLREIERNGDR